MKRFLRFVVVVLLGSALAAGGLAGWLLRTQAGRDRLAAGLAQRIERATGYGVEIRGLAGALPGRGRVAEVRVSDAQDAWLVVSNLSWQMTLLQGRHFAPRLQRVDAEVVDWRRAAGSCGGARAARGSRAWLRLPRGDVCAGGRFSRASRRGRAGVRRRAGRRGRAHPHRLCGPGVGPRGGSDRARDAARLRLRLAGRGGRSGHERAAAGRVWPAAM